MLASLRRHSAAGSMRLAALLPLLCALLLCTALPGLHVGASAQPQQHAFLPASLAAPLTADDAPHGAGANLLDLLSASRNHTLFVRMLQRTRLVPTINRLMLLDDGSGLTIFAPTDAAVLRQRDAERELRMRAAQGAAFRDDDGFEMRSPAWPYPRQARSVWEWAVELAAQPEMAPAEAAALSVPVWTDARREEQWHTLDNVHALLRTQLLYHMLNYTLPYDVLALGAGGRPLPPVGHADMLTTLHRPSRRTLHTPTRPGPVPTPPSSPPHPGAEEDEGGLLGGHGQRLRLAQREQKDGAPQVWIGTDSRGQGGAQAVRFDTSSHSGTLVWLDGVLSLPPDLETVLQTHPALGHLANLSSASLLSTLCETAHTTFFLPEAGAFDALSSLERSFLRGPWELAVQDRVKLIGWHMSGLGVGEGRIGYAERLREAGVNITTTLGGEVPVSTLDNGTVVINHSRIVEEDILVENGVVHIVSDLLLPGGSFGMTIEKTLLALNASRFVALMHSAGLSAYIDEDPRDPDHDATNASWTFMVPRDDVLDEWLAQQDAQRAYHANTWRLPGIDALDKSGPLNGTRLLELMRYHVAPSKLTPAKLSDGMLIETELRDAKLKDARQRLAVAVAERKGSESAHQGNGDVAFGDANVIAEPVEVGGSVIYLISQLLSPPLNPIQTAVSSLSLSTFVATVFSAELDKAIKSAPGISYLVPHNDAFEALGLAMPYLLLPREESRAELRSVVEYHALDRIVYLADFAKGSTRYPTLEGSSIWAGRSENGTIEVRRGLEGRNARVLRGDLLTSTGVLHEIDQVELPPTLDLTSDKLMRGAKAGTMRSLIMASGYGWILNGTAPDSPEKAAQLESAISVRGEKGNHGRRGQKKRHRKRHNLFADGHQSYIILCPTDAAFAHVNLSYYLNSPDALNELVQLHILPSPADETLAGGTALRLPLALRDAGSFASLLDRSLGGLSRFGRISFRRDKKGVRRGDEGEPGSGDDDDAPLAGWLVGIEGTRGTDGKRHSARVLGFGRESLSISRDDAVRATGEGWTLRKSGHRLPTPIEGDDAWNSRSVGGILTIDAVLQPYVPSWFYRWGWIVLVVLMVLVILTGMGYALWRWWHADGRIRLPDALEGEED